jgi:hypothetical protein
MIKLLPNSNSEQKIITEPQSIAKAFADHFSLFLTLLVVQKLRTTLSTLVLISKTFRTSVILMLSALSVISFRQNQAAQMRCPIL